MKRILLVTAASLALSLPVAGSGAYAQPNYGHDDHRNDNDHRNNNDHGAWDPGQHNGYTYNGRWHYGRPPATVVVHRGYAPGWHQWRRGDRLPSDFRTRYIVVNDWRGAHLRQPPRGYHWVRDDRGEYLLVGIATGLIASLILGSH
jgi:Ni/Co efflux regulator RcnB